MKSCDHLVSFMVCLLSARSISTRPSNGITVYACDNQYVLGKYFLLYEMKLLNLS